MTEPCYHLGFSAADLGTPLPDAVLLCGDPQRSRQIARHPELRCLRTLSENRGLDCFLLEDGNGRRLLAATSGMGAPSLSIVVNELVQAGLTCFLRVGTCGGIGGEVRTGDLVISSAALCRQGAARDIAPEEYPAAADPFLCVALAAAAAASGHPWHLGVTASVDTFYEGQERTASSANPHLLPHLQGITASYRHLGLLNYEMEAGTLFKMAGVYGVTAGCLCAVLADRKRGERIEAGIKERAVAAAIDIALEGIRRWRGTDCRPAGRDVRPA
jgi:uridine phosphorylase